MKKFFFSSFILIFFLIIIYISLNSNFRRSFLNLSSGLINNYYLINIKKNLISEQAISKSIRILENQIKITDYITTSQKNSFIDNIYYNLNLIEKNIDDKKNFLLLSNVIKKLISKDPNIYDALIWNAKIMSYENKDSEKVYEQIDQAIKLSPANAKAYKFAIDYSNRNNNKEKIQNYCKGYHKSFLGSFSSKDNISKFSETSMTRFVIQIGASQEIKNYIVEGVTLNNAQDYIVGFEKPSDLSNFILMSNFFPGTLINILNIELKTINDETIKVPLAKIYISLQNSFIINNSNFKKIFINSYDDEKISFKFDDEFKDIIQIKFKMNISKANITNLPNC
tara:strand:- start:324 stop:1340 length:1017 start_codon:yes stop_codon:yes gene_type:complete